MCIEVIVCNVSVVFLDTVYFTTTAFVANELATNLRRHNLFRSVASM